MELTTIKRIIDYIIAIIAFVLVVLAALWGILIIWYAIESLLGRSSSDPLQSIWS